jgi:hypothetical protein
MPFDPAKPVEGTLCDAAEMRAQLTGLKDLIDALPTQAQLSNDLVNCQNAAVSTALPLTSNNSNLVSPLTLVADGSYDPGQIQTVMDKIDELINALRR